MKIFKKTLSIVLVIGMILSVVMFSACGNDTETPEATVTAITLDTTGAKCEYTVGETFTAEGLLVTATMSDNTQKSVNIAECTVSSPDMTTAGEKTVTVTYSQKSANYSITVNEAGHVCTEKCPVCGKCLDLECTEDACLDKCGDGLDSYTLQAEDEHVELVAGAGVGGVTELTIYDIASDSGIDPEIREKNAGVVYVGNYSENVGASINYTFYVANDTTATLIVTVNKRRTASIFTQNVGVLVNNEMIERDTGVPDTGTGVDTWGDFIDISLGCISLKAGTNTIKFTNITSNFGYNFDRIIIKSSEPIGWSEDEMIAPDGSVPETPPETDTPEVCDQICATCGKCLDASCVKEGCSEKCLDSRTTENYLSIGGEGSKVIAHNDNPNRQVAGPWEGIYYMCGFTKVNNASLRFIVDVDSTESITASLEVYVAKTTFSGVYTDYVDVIINDVKLESSAVMPAISGSEQDGYVYIKLNLGCITLNAGRNVIDIIPSYEDAPASRPEGYGFDFSAIYIMTDGVTVTWYDGE